VGSGHLATVLQCYTLHFAAPATQQPSDPAIQRLAPASSLQPPASSLQPPTSNLQPPAVFFPPTPLPQCSTAHLGFAGILDVGAWGLSVPLLLVSSYSLQYARPAPESRQTAESADQPDDTQPTASDIPVLPIILPHRCSLCYLRLARPCRRRLSAPTRDCPPPAHSSLSPTTEPRVTTAPCSALSISDCTGCSVLTALCCSQPQSSNRHPCLVVQLQRRARAVKKVALLLSSQNSVPLLTRNRFSRVSPPPTHLGQPREILE
jgi:hypothetical protein